MKSAFVEARVRRGLCLLAVLLLAAGVAPGEEAPSGRVRGAREADADAGVRLILQTSPLAGFQHYAGRALFPLMRVGDALSLRREPANPYDPRAVRVEWNGVQIGYAPRAENVDLARLMDRGTPVAARILHLQPGRDPWKRVMMEIYVAEPASR